MVTEGRRWKKYDSNTRKNCTEGTQTQRTPLTKNYEDEPAVMEIAMKEALIHMYNGK